MSINFFVRGSQEIEALNMSASNAANLLEWLGYYEEALSLDGVTFRAKELIERCKTALERPLDGGIPESQGRGPNGAEYIRCARWPGYLHRKTEELLDLCKQAGELGVILIEE